MAETRIVMPSQVAKWWDYIPRFLLTPYQSPAKIANLAGVLWQNLLMTDRVRARPFKLIIEPSNLCNLKCPLCPTGRGVRDRRKDFLDFDTFRRVVDPLLETLYEVYLFNWGEPLLNSELFRMVKHLSNARIRTVVSTNLNLVKNDLIDRILDSNLDTLIASLDGASQDTYKLYRRNGDFAAASENLKNLVSARDARGGKLPRIIWQYVVFSFNQHQIKEATARAREWGVDEIRFISTYPKMEEMAFTNSRQKMAQMAGYQSSEAEYQLYASPYSSGVRSRWSCDYLWAQMSIRSDGGVAPCCGSYYKKDDFGCIETSALLEIWNNPRYRAARRAVRCKGRAPSNTICDSCLKNELMI